MKQVTEEFFIDLPAFFKKGNDYYGLLHENTLLNIYHSDGLTLMKNTIPMYDSTCRSGFQECEPITETAFFDAWEKGLKNLNLKPYFTKLPAKPNTEPPEIENGNREREDEERWMEHEHEKHLKQSE
jgi:hypothetical protein